MKKNNSKKSKVREQNMIEQRKQKQEAKRSFHQDDLIMQLNYFSKKVALQLTAMKINILNPKSQYQERKQKIEEEQKMQKEKMQRKKQQKYEEQCQICQREFSEKLFPLKLKCKHTFCIECLQQLASGKVDLRKQLFILECPYRDGQPLEIQILNNVISDLLFRTLGYPSAEAYQSKKMKDLVTTLKSQKKLPPWKFAPGITLTYECVDCNPAPVKQVYCGLRAYSLVNMEEQECNRCYSLMPITQIFFQDCAYQIKGDGDEKVSIKGNCVGKNYKYKLASVGWDYLDFKASKPNT